MQEAVPGVGSAHINVAHAVAAPATQAPMPSHDIATVLVISVEHVVPQLVVVGRYWQPPAPLHLPFLPHTDTSSVHMPLGSTPSAATFSHVPLFAPAHVLQLPEQAVVQHTPCAQIPEAHSPPTVHISATAFFATHMVPEQ